MAQRKAQVKSSDVVFKEIPLGRLAGDAAPRPA
jgi:hypothetical protein